VDLTGQPAAVDLRQFPPPRDGCALESRMLAQGPGLQTVMELGMPPENLERWETAVAASLVIAISVVVITLVLNLGSGIGL
jgi:hypothetical protein